MSWKDFRVPDEYLGVARYAEEGSKYIISTPYKIACEMVELLPEELFVPETKFLNIFSKSGQILLALRNRLMESEAMIKRFPNKRHRRNHIVWHQLYGLCMTERCVDSTAIMLYDTAWNNYNNIVKCEKLISLVKEDKNKVLEFIHKNFKEYNEFLNESEDTGEIMKFDVVIGNPPYNNDMYIPFVEMGHNLSQKCSVFITPAKWQAKGGKQNEAFRKNIVPHMKEIVYYPDAGDVFNIRLQGGVCYYIVDKNTYVKKAITSHCSRVPKFSNDKRERAISKPVFLDADICYSICDKVGCFNNSFKQFNPKWVAIKGNINIFVTAINTDGGGKTSFNVFSRDGSLTMLAPFNRSIEIFFRSNDTKCIYSAKTCEEADSFESWCGSKFVRFMLLMRYCTYHNNNDYSWSFVPDPGAFDHIFTDEELYKKYNLTEEEINIIESVIKERKQNL